MRGVRHLQTQSVLPNLTWLFVMGAVGQLGVLSGDAVVIIFILRFIPISRLFYAWGFPIRY